MPDRSGLHDELAQTVLASLVTAENREGNSMTDNIHPAQAHLLRYFAYGHLPEHLQLVSRPFSDLAYYLTHGRVEELDGPGEDIDLDGPELTVALRKLLEAKDAAVRAALETES